MSGVDMECPCPCGCGQPVPAGRRWATASCGNKARAARRRERCPELRPDLPGKEIWQRLTQEQRREIASSIAALERAFPGLWSNAAAPEAEEIWEKLTQEQRQGIMNAAAAHAWRDWMLINEKEAAKRETFPSRRRRPDPRTGKKRPRVYLREAQAEDLDGLIARGWYPDRKTAVDAALHRLLKTLAGVP